MIRLLFLSLLCWFAHFAHAQVDTVYLTDAQAAAWFNGTVPPGIPDAGIAIIKDKESSGIIQFRNKQMFRFILNLSNGRIGWEVIVENQAVQRMKLFTPEG